METIDAAILRTVLYADVFHFPLTPAELHHFLIYDQPVSAAVVADRLARSALLQQKLVCKQGYITCCGREDLIVRRLSRDAAALELWPLALRYGLWLSRLPFVRMVALTGALAMRNPTHARDDLDYLLVTIPRRVWLARAFSILLVRLARLQGVEICPNYVLAESSLAQEQRDIFIAHEVTQMVPLYGHDLYRHLRDCNPWVGAHLANADDVFYAQAERPLGHGWRILKTLLERLLAGRVGDALEDWEYRRKLRRFAAQMRTPYSAAQLDEGRVKGHFNDHGHFVLREYAARLREHGLESVALSKAGD
ncbi:MAG: hypothetical protein HZC41_20885 [Chloroflexi bacterium]|nr:hypothetical protein [Chloroflexota bacterium]